MLLLLLLHLLQLGLGQTHEGVFGVERVDAAVQGVDLVVGGLVLGQALKDLGDLLVVFCKFAVRHQEVSSDSFELRVLCFFLGGLCLGEFDDL